MSRIEPLPIIQTPAAGGSAGSRFQAARQALMARQKQQIDLQEAQRKAREAAGYNAAVAAGGTPEEILARTQQVGAEAYTDFSGFVSKAKTEELQQAKARLEGAKVFTDQMATVASNLATLPEDRRQQVYQQFVATMKRSRMPLSENLPEQYDPTFMAQFEDAKTRLDIMAKELEMKLKTSGEERAVAKEGREVEQHGLDTQVKQATLAGTLPTEDMRNFDQSGYYQKYLRDKGINPASLNPETERATKADAYVEWKKNPANMQSENVIPEGGKDDEPVLANYHPDKGYYTEAKPGGKILDGARPYIRPEAGAGGLNPNQFALEKNRLTTQWTNATKTAAELDRQLGIMKQGMEAAKRGDMAAGSQAVLVTFQKILDPESVVRESEYARSASGQALLARIQGAYDRLAKGGAGVPLAELQKFADLAEQMATGAGAHRKAVKARIARNADYFGIPQNLIFEDYEFGTGGTVTPPPTGTTTTTTPGASVDDAMKALEGLGKKR